MLNTWQQVIKNRMKLTGETQESLAEKLNVTQGSIAHWLSGRRKPDVEIITSMMRHVGIKEVSLHNNGETREIDNLPIKPLDVDSYLIEVLDVTASAGGGFINSDIQEVIKLIEFDKSQAKSLFNGISSDKIKVINIRGDSMQGTFESGDSVYVDISKQSFEGDGIYVFSFGKGIYIKRLQLIKDVIRVKSDNTLYDPWEITEKEMYKLHIHGKVIFSQSMLLRKHG